MRILGQGRLCELLDDTDDNLKIDRFFRRLNWKRDVNGIIYELEPETLSWAQSICDGINAGLSARKFSLIKLMTGDPEPWTVADIVLLFRMTSYLTLAQTQAESERLFIELVQDGVSDEKLQSLFPLKDQDYDRSLIEKIKLEERILPLEMLWQAAIPRMMASNNWVVSGDRTKSGAALMANDPHLEVNRLPNVWYEAALSCPCYEATGFGMPGLPGLLIGRTASVSWGATYTFADTVDSWIQECKDGKYRRGKSWKKFEQRQEHIIRKKHCDHIETFYENNQGVVDGTPRSEGFYLSTLWSPDRYGARSLNAMRALVSASTATETQDALGQVESAWNWVIADKSGDIAYQMSGLCPKRSNNWNGFTPGLGWDKNYDWNGFHKPSDLPNVFNPAQGYFSTANQDLNQFGNVSPINMPMADHRARRIDQLLEQNDQQDIETTRAIQMDCYSLQAEEYMQVLTPILKSEFEGCLLAEVLLDWNGKYDKYSTGASLFEAFYTQLRQHVFQDEQISPELSAHMREQTCLFIDFYQNFDRCLVDENSVWYQGTSQLKAFKAAFDKTKNDFESITWGEQNTFQFTNILLQGKLPLIFGVDSAPVPMIGGRATPHQGQLYESAGRKTSFAASVRIVADMSENVLHSRIAGGVSDNPFSPWYMSEVSGWLAGSFKQVKL